MKKHLKKILAGALAFSLIAVGCTGKSSQSVATINENSISYDNYLKKMAVFKLQVEMTFGNESWEEKVPDSGKTFIEHFKEDILNSMIEDSIIEQEAKKQNIKIDEEERKKNIEQLMTSINSSESLKKYYTDNKIDDEFIKSSVTEDLTRIELEKKYSQENPVTQEEIDKHYETNKEEYSNDEVRASHIIITTTSPDGKDLPQDKIDEAKKQMDDIYIRAIGGEKFEDLAKQYSQDGTKDSGGDLGFFSRGRMVQEFDNVVFSMNVGDISKPFKTRFGYHIVKLTDKKAGEVNMEQVKTFIKTELQVKKFSDYINSLKSSAKITKNEDLIKNAEKDIKPYEAPKLQEEPAPMQKPDDAKKEENKDKK